MPTPAPQQHAHLPQLHAWQRDEHARGGLHSRLGLTSLHSPALDAKLLPGCCATCCWAPGHEPLPAEAAERRERGCGESHAAPAPLVRFQARVQAKCTTNFAATHVGEGLGALATPGSTIQLRHITPAIIREASSMSTGRFPHRDACAGRERLPQPRPATAPSVALGRQPVWGVQKWCAPHGLSGIEIDQLQREWDGK